MKRNPHQTKQNVENMRQFWIMFGYCAAGTSLFLIVICYSIYQMHMANKRVFKELQRQLKKEGKNPADYRSIVGFENLSSLPLTF